MTDLYENLLKATSNIDDITTEKYGVITKLDGLYCSVKETDNELEHNNVPIVNGANLSVGDKVIIGFLNNSIYDVVCYGALDKTVHDDSKQDTLISGENIKTINHQSLLGSGNITIEGGGGDVPIVANWTSNPSDTRVPSEKLTKNTLDTKSNVGHTHDDRYYTETEIDDALLIKQDLLVSGTNIKTVNNESLLGSGNITIQGGSSVDVVTSWEATLSDTKVPSEKLVKNTIDGLSIPTKTSDLTNDGDGTNAFLTQHQSLSNYVQKSSTTGLLKNDGSVDTTQYLSSLPSHNHDDRYYTESEVDTALNGKQATLISGNNIKTINNTSLLGSGNITIGGGGSSVDIATSWGNPTSDSKVPSEKLTKSSLDSKIDKSQTVGLVKNDGTIDTTSYSTFSGSYNDLTNKPSIPSKTSDLTNDSNFISKSSTNGLMKNDGTIDTTTYVNTNDSRLSDARTPLSHTHTSSQVTDLIDVIYPVGSIYMSVNSTSPQTLFGGTWEQIKDTFLLASGDTYANGTTGGSADAVVVSHTHPTDRDYILTTDGSGVLRNSSAGQTGTKVSNLLQSADAIYRNQVNSAGESGTGKNMPPYLTVFVWKRTA